MRKPVTILTGEPVISVMAEMAMNWDGVRGMAKWVKSHRPECIPDDWDPDAVPVRDDVPDEYALFPHDHYRESYIEHGNRLPAGEATLAWERLAEDEPHKAFLSDNELLAELAGRKCYDSFGLKAGQKTNRDYLKHTQMLTDPKKVAWAIVDGSTKGGSAGMEEAAGKIAEALQEERDRVPHASITYHAKMTFFIAGVSRRVSQEMMRNYIGSDRDYEGSPSQESTRFTYHYGFFVPPPAILGDVDEMQHYEKSAQRTYDDYMDYIDRQVAKFEQATSQKCAGMDRKRILESAIGRMPWDFETSYIWTSNPGALAKMLKERDNKFADAEFQRFAKKLKRVCLERWPNLFPMFDAEAR